MCVLLCFKFMLLQITYCSMSLQGWGGGKGGSGVDNTCGDRGAVHCWGVGVEAGEWWRRMGTPDLSDNSPPCAVPCNHSVMSVSLRPHGL